MDWTKEKGNNSEFVWDTTRREFFFVLIEWNSHKGNQIQVNWVPKTPELLKTRQKVLTEGRRNASTAIHTN